MKFKKAFTLMEIMIVMLIIGIGLMSLTPKFTSKSVGIDPQLDYLDKLIKAEWERSIELGQPIVMTGFKGSANILNHDKETKTIPEIKEVVGSYILATVIILGLAVISYGFAKMMYWKQVVSYANELSKIEMMKKELETKVKKTKDKVTKDIKKKTNSVKKTVRAAKNKK